jgi:hypothetical protein
MDAAEFQPGRESLGGDESHVARGLACAYSISSLEMDHCELS